MRILSLAEVYQPESLERWLGSRDGQRLLVFCDEDAPTRSYGGVRWRDATHGTDVPGSAPEGGRSAEDERAQLLKSRTSCGWHQGAVWRVRRLF